MLIAQITRKLLTSLFLITYFICSGQDIYSELRDKYWEFEENDPKAFTYINLSIASAKREKNYSELYQIYDDAVRFSPDNKLKYADSAIAAAKLSGNKDLIGSSHVIKGIIFYFNYRKFQPALDEYLKAYPYLKNAEDPFLKYENIYHIGVVKSYLGYYEEAMPLFKECIKYFEQQTKSDIHPNLIINNQKGYLNSLHQLIICYQAMGKNSEAEKLITIGLESTPANPFFNLEKSYFQKAKGIDEFKKKNYQNAIVYFDKAIPELIKLNDFTWASVVFFNKAQCLKKLGREKLAVDNYQKVDSIFKKYHFILPEIRKNYEELIAHYRKGNDIKQELYYTNQLLKADDIISKDFKYLSKRINREYDTQSLTDAKAELETYNFWGKFLLVGCLIVICILAMVVIYWFGRKKAVQIKYEQLLSKINNEVKVSSDKEIFESNTINRSLKLEENIAQKILKSMADFEKSKAFLEKGLTLNRLAAEFETNTSYLSQVINEYKGTNFNTYINTLRIKFATQKIYSDKEWRKYSVEDIATQCGFSNRQSFSNIFFEQNGIRPADFIKKRREELVIQN